VFLAIIRMALTSLKVNKLRTLLSMLGIVIGVGAVIAIISIGSSAQQDVTREIETLGSNIIWVSPSWNLSSADREELFTMEVAAELEALSPSVAQVVPEKTSGGRLTYQGESVDTTIVGTTPGYATINLYQPVAGRFLDQTDIEDLRNTVVLGSDMADEFFSGEEAVGERITISYNNRRSRFTVIGVMEDKGQVFAGNLDAQVYIPITTHLARMSTTNDIDTIYAEGAANAPAAQARQQVDYFFYRYLGDSDDYSIFSQDQILQVLDEVSTTLTLMLGGIAAISLLVGGIGIMNIMLVSVTERTREIGIRKALGAKKRHILAQFLFEALSLSGFGGIIGIGLGWLATYFVTDLGGWEMVVSPIAVGLAFGFALIIGIFFGLYPAIKAARLDPVDSLSYE